MINPESIAVAERLWDVGLSAIPFKVTKGGEVVGLKGWTKYCDNPPSREEQAKFRKLFLADHNAVFLACGRVFEGKRFICVDVDDDRLVPLVEVILGKTICGRFGSKGIGIFAWPVEFRSHTGIRGDLHLLAGRAGIGLLCHLAHCGDSRALGAR